MTELAVSSQPIAEQRFKLGKVKNPPLTEYPAAPPGHNVFQQFMLTEMDW